ncbi:MAG: hypothetical protein NC431_06975 [Firmicutes bacterium]|nr:hypothetical protein [Bacillota bacterium]MCM1509129.1 hypothetical protein [Clostridium sp.]
MTLRGGGKPDNYDSDVQKRFRLLKLRTPSEKEIEAKNIYNNCKESIKNKSIAFRQAYNVVKESKGKLPKTKYMKLLVKLIFYRLR